LFIGLEFGQAVITFKEDRSDDERDEAQFRRSGGVHPGLLST
jgi:hypothetical protein